MFTLEINGTAIAVVHADETETRNLLDDEDFKEDLQSLTSEGEPLWNGRDPFVLRPATEAEIEAAEEEDEDDMEGDILVAFIVPVDEDDNDDLDDEL